MASYFYLNVNFCLITQQAINEEKGCFPNRKVITEEVKRNIYPLVTDLMFHSINHLVSLCTCTLNQFCQMFGVAQENQGS